MTAHVCWEKMWNGWAHYPCRNKAKVERNGKWYCGVHDPERRKKRNDERMAAVRADNARREELWAASGRRCEALGMGRRDPSGGVVLSPAEADDLIVRIDDWRSR